LQLLPKKKGFNSLYFSIHSRPCGALRPAAFKGPCSAPMPALMCNLHHAQILSFISPRTEEAKKLPSDINQLMIDKSRLFIERTTWNK